MNRDLVQIVGHGGGGKGGGAGGISEGPDTLKSHAYARIALALCEGEIEGLVNGLQSVYLDGVPLQNSDGSMNFTGFSAAMTFGTQGQNAIPGLDGTESETAVSVELLNSTPATRSITDSNVDRVRVTLSVPSLYKTNSDGSITGTAVEVAIDVQSDGGGYVTVVDDTISGKTTGKYQRSYMIYLDQTPPYDIRVRRITADDSSGTLQDHTYWDSYTEIVDAKLRFPNTAMGAIAIDSSQFSKVPTVSFLAKLLRVQVPSNYDASTRTYTGSWDGTFQIAWTDNPAWCFYDLVTNERYGLGRYVAADQVDKWALYSIAQYCDELVDDGKGGTEPRFTCNAYMQSQQEAFTVLNQMAGVFRGMLYWSSGAVTAVQDAPSDPVALYTPSNVLDGQFEYAGSALNARHTVALVTWNDPDNQYQQTVEYVEDSDGIARYGVIQTEVLAFGCTSQGQAQRVGRWLLYSERLQSETVTFKTGLEGLKCRPGQVINVADPARAGERLGGRIQSSTTTSVVLDSTVTLDPAQTYTLNVIVDGAILTADVTVPGTETTIDTLSLSSALSSAPPTGAVWILAASNVEPQQFRVVAVQESEKATYTVTALAHDPNKYAAVESDTVVIPAPISTLLTPLDAPANFAVAEYQDTAQAGVVRTDLVFGWDAVPYAAAYLLTYQINNSLPKTVKLNTPGYNEIVHEAGAISATVAAVNASGVKGKDATATTTTVTPAPVPPMPEFVYVVAPDGTYGPSTHTPASSMNVAVFLPKDTYNIPEPQKLIATDLIEVTNGINTTSSTKKIYQVNISPPFNRYYQNFNLPGLGSLTADVVNQYGNACAINAYIPIPTQFARIFQSGGSGVRYAMVSSAGISGAESYANAGAMFMATSASSGTFSISILSVNSDGSANANYFTAISWAKVYGDDFTIGSITSISGGSGAGGYTTPFTNTGSPGDAKSAIYKATVTFDDSSTADVYVGVGMAFTDSHFGFTLN